MPADAEDTPVHVEGVGEPTQACFFTLSKVDPKNWYVTTFLGTRQLQPGGGGELNKSLKSNRWMFEKYDGVRGFWNPERRTFYSRYGRALPMPKDIIDVMPSDTYLDGELW